jgi:hypothetical protein
MATFVFSFAYQLNIATNQVTVSPNGTDVTITSIADDTLTTNEVFNYSTANPTPPLQLSGSAMFLFQSGDGIVIQISGQKLWLTDTARTAGTTASDSGTSFTLCLLSGSRISTPDGTIAVEALTIGDLVLTADGGIASVRWIGVQSVVTLFADPLRTLPIRITAGALGEDLPIRDLRVSPDHALLLDGVLVRAGALVNGVTIVRETAVPDRFTYYHVELDDHSLILAEGVPAETFLDTISRRRFDNWAEYEALHGDRPATIAELDAPRVKSARQLPLALRERLAARLVGATKAA